MSGIYEELEELEFLQHLDDGQDEDGKEFKIDNDKKADWALNIIAEERKEVERLKELAKKQIEEIEMKIKYIEEKSERKTAFLKSCLAQYFETVPHKSTKTQETYKLLSGSLIFKLPKQNMVKDDTKLLEYLKENKMTEYIKTEEKPVWNEFKKTLSIVDGKVVDTSTGEVVEAVKAEEVAGVFDVKTS